VRANNRRGGGEGKARNTGVRERNLSSNTKPEEYDVKNAEWELHHPSRQAKWQQHGQKAEGGK
jgi:hypothetical protein